MLVKNKQTDQLYNRAVNDYATLFSTTYRHLADSAEFSVVYIVQPMRSDIKYQDGFYTHMQRLDSLLKVNKCTSINLLPSMEKAIVTDTSFHYSWKIDGHYNGKGYAVMGQIIADTLGTINFHFEPSEGEQ
ncbi:MAG TPA: hypothetical protein DCR04_03375 [Flavobacteriales bacterium]|nr:hypothetical protein [Flavobacteriales bacterium]